MEKVPVQEGTYLTDKRNRLLRVLRTTNVVVGRKTQHYVWVEDCKGWLDSDGNQQFSELRLTLEEVLGLEPVKHTPEAVAA